MSNPVNAVEATGQSVYPNWDEHSCAELVRSASRLTRARKKRRIFMSKRATALAAITTPSTYNLHSNLKNNEPGAMAKQKQINAYLWSVILVGGLVTIAALTRVPWANLGFRFLLL